MISFILKMAAQNPQDQGNRPIPIFPPSGDEMVTPPPPAVGSSETQIKTPPITPAPQSPEPKPVVGQPQNTQTPINPTPPITPAPQMPASPTAKPVSSVPPVPPANVSPEAVTTSGDSKPKKSFPKKLFLIPLIIILLSGLAFSVWKFVLPSLGNLGGGGEATIIWWGLWEDDTIVEPIIAEYEANHPGIKINYEAQSKEDYRERLMNSLARGEGPDIFRIHNSWVPMFKSELSAMPSSVMTAQEFAQTFYPVAVSDLTVGAEIVGMPLMYDGLGLYLNEEIFNTYGKTPPTTWDELLELALELTIKDENGVIQQAGVAMGLTENVDHWQEIVALMMLQNGASLVNPTNNLASSALDYYKAINRRFSAWDKTLPPSTIMFANGDLAMYFAPSWRAFEIVDLNPSLQFRVVPVPQLRKDDPSEPDLTYATYWVEGVWERSDHANEAWEFLDFLTQKETLTKFYTQASATRLFGEPYPRPDMQDLISTDPILGGIIRMAPNAKSWYLASRTHDGETGINSRIGDYYMDAVNAGDSAGALRTTASGVQQVLSQYGLVSTTQSQ